MMRRLVDRHGDFPSAAEGGAMTKDATKERRRFEFHSEPSPFGSAPTTACGHSPVTERHTAVTPQTVINDNFGECRICGALVAPDIDCFAADCPGLPYGAA